MALFWLGAFLSSLFTQFLSAIFEASAAFALTVLVRAMTGIKMSFSRLSIRFGAGKGAPTEFVLSGIKIWNPAGGYCSPYLLEIIRADIHVDVLSYLRSKKWVQFAYPPKEDDGEDGGKQDPAEAEAEAEARAAAAGKDAPPKAAFKLDLFVSAHPRARCKKNRNNLAPSAVVVKLHVLFLHVP